MRTYRVLPSLALLGLLALTAACTSAGSSVSQAAPAPDHPSGPAAAATAETVDPTKIDGLSIVNDSSNDRFCPWATSYPDIPGASAMTAAMKDDVQQRLTIFLGPAGSDSGGAASGCAGSAIESAGQGSELNISFSLLVASGDVAGVRLSTQDWTTVGDGLMTRTYWYDGVAGAYLPAHALIADGSYDAFASAVAKQLEGQEGVDDETLGVLRDTPASRDGVVDDLAFTTDGGLLVAFDRGDVGVPAGGRYTVTLPRTTVTPWLSGFGKRAQEQATNPSGILDLGASSTPAPEESAPAGSAPAEPAPGTDPTDCSEVKCIALTFDDGPAAPETTTLLTYLEQYQARVTFFTVGQNVAAHPELVRAEAEAGHEIGNHSWNHPDLTRLTTSEVKSQLDRTSAAIKAATGKEPTVYRPPYGAINDSVRSATTLSPVLWDVDTEDWKYRDAAKVAQTAISQAHPDAVILMHDIHPTSVAAVPDILSTLTERGYHFVTISHLRATL